MILRLARLVAAVSVLTVLTLQGACFDTRGPLAPIGHVESGGGTAGTQSPSLVGRWSNTVLITTPTGDVQSSQTIWSFRADGTADRTVITRSVAAGVADTVVSSARWATSGARVTITFDTPGSGTVTFDFSVSGDTLTLGGQTFTRIG